MPSPPRSPPVVAPIVRSYPRPRRGGRTAPLFVALLVAFVVTGLVPSAGSGGARTSHPSLAPLPSPAAAAQSLTNLLHGPSSARSHAWTCQGLRMFGSAACGAVPHAGVANVTGWLDAGPNPPPQSTNDFYLVDDASDGYVLLFGTTTSAPSDAAGIDEWAYANGTWTALTLSSPMPYPCPGSEIAYDSTDGYVLYLGGSNFPYGPSCPSANQTWTYHGGTWTRQSPTTSPSGIVLAAMSDDPVDGDVVLFGGEGSTACGHYGYCGATWQYAAGAWTNLSLTSAPSPRGEAGMAYDAHDGYVVLFGGYSAGGASNDTWKFRNGTWTELYPKTSPPTPQPDAFSYDAADNAVVYTTAQNDSDPAISEITWTYSGGNWTEVNSTRAPSERLDGQMADDPATGIPVFFGGLGGLYGQVALDDSWTLHAGSWTNVTAPAPSARIDTAVAYDPDTQSVLLFGGTTAQTSGSANDTWSYANGSWSRLAPSRVPTLSSTFGMCWDAADGYMLLLGGANNGTVETWEYAGGTWSEVTPAQEPPGLNIVYDAADGYVLGLAVSAGVALTWTYHAGVWTNRTATAGTPPPTYDANTLVYDSTDAEVVMFGAYFAPGGSTTPWIAPYTYTFSGGTWHNATVANATAPPGLYWASSADDPGDGGALFWGGNIGAGGPLVNNATWLFANGTWSSLGAPTHPSARVGMYGAYDTATGQAVFFGGGAAESAVPCGYGAGYCGDTWLWGSHVSKLPIIQSFQASPYRVDLGRSVTFSLAVGGGSPPYTYGYSALPPGCASVNASWVNCTPTGVGVWNVEAIVVDALGQSASAFTTFTVLSDVSVTSFVGVPASVTLGSLTTLEVAVAGGTGSYSYTYSGLPGGCASQDVPALPCTPSSSGNFTVRVNVTDTRNRTDSAGSSTSSTTSLTVAAAGGHGAPTITRFAATPNALVLGNATNFSVSASGAAPLSYAYTGLPAGCASSNASAVACTPTSAGTFSVRVTVLDTHHNATSVTTNLTVYPAGGGAGLAVTAFGANPGTLAVNTTTFLDVVASGGHGPLTYAYTGLPPGCASINTSTLPCAPTRTGTFDAAVQVVDAVGDHAGVRAIIEVIASAAVLPQVSAFVATPERVEVNSSLTLFVAVGGGTLPFHYDFGDLPAGCASVNGPVLVCYPSVPGNYRVAVTVTDANGHTAQASTPVEVVGIPGPGTIPGKTTLANGAPAWVGELTDGAAAIAGAALIAGVAVLWDRQRRRREGDALVAALDRAGATDDLSALP